MLSRILFTNSSLSINFLVYFRLLTSFSKNKGLEGLCDKLKVDVKRGLTAADLPERREHFGSNEMKKPEAEGFWAKVWEALKEFMLRVLMVAGCFSIIVDMLVSDA